MHAGNGTARFVAEAVEKDVYENCRNPQRLETPASHQTVLRPAPSFPWSPTRSQHIGGLAIDTVGSVDPELIADPFVHTGRADMGVELGHFRGDVLANQEVG